MKSLGLFFLGLCWTFAAHAELDTLWIQRIPLTGNAVVFDGAVLLNDGSVLATAASTAESVVRLWKLDADGNVLWEDTVAFPAPASVLDLCPLSDGNAAVAGSYYLSPQLGTALHLKGLSPAGDELWNNVVAFPSVGPNGGLAPLSDNTIAFFTTVYDDTGNARATLLKFSNTGDTLWTRVIAPLHTYSNGYDVVELADGDLVVCGYYTNDIGQYVGYVMRTTPTGEPVWTNLYPGDLFGSLMTCLGRDNQDNLVAGGGLGGIWWMSWLFAVGLTPDGGLRWSTTTLNDECLPSGIRTLPNGGAIVVGTAHPDFGFITGKVYSLSTDGEPHLEIQYPGSYSEFSGMNQKGALDAIAFGGELQIDGSQEGILIRFGPGTFVSGHVLEAGTQTPVEHARVELVETGEYAFTSQLGAFFLSVSLTTGTLRVSHPCTETVSQTVEMPEGEETVVNFALGVPEYVNDVSSLNMIATLGVPVRDTITIENDGDGDLQFSTTVHEQNPTYGWLAAAPASGVLPAGQSADVVVTVLANPEHPETEFFGELRVHHNSCPDTVNEIGIYVLALDSPEQSPIPAEFTVSPAYPNPFNATARVAFELAKPASVSATLYAIDGRVAMSIAAREFTAGRHELKLGSATLATGMYLLRVTAGAASHTQKLLLLK